MSESKESLSSTSSYPPIFLQQKNPVEPENRDTTKLNQNPIPTIDLQCINQNHLDEACKDWGIFRVQNHEIPITLLTHLQEHAKKLFLLPFETKQTLFKNSPISYFWGTPALNRSGVALSKGASSSSSSNRNVNWVEGFHVSLTEISVDMMKSEGHDNDPLVVAFELLLEDYGKHLARIGSTIYEAMIENLKKDSSNNYSKSYMHESTGLIRVYRYLKGSGSNNGYGMEAHTDSSILSILSEDDTGGLQVLKDNNWNRIEHISNTLVVNLGDMTQAVTNDKYKSIQHRVKIKKEEERISICYFVFPEDDCVIESSKYKPFSYGEFRAQVQEDVKTLGFKVGLERFKKLD